MDFSTTHSETTTITESLPSLMYMDYPSTQQQPLLLPSPSLTVTANTYSTHSKRSNKVHVSAACINCKKAHLACDVSRPCQRCINTDKVDTCRDIQHKKRGRPKMLRDVNNNNKIKRSLYKSVTLPPDLLFSMNRDMMTIFLSMDLCCARVSDKSFQYLELYPQEFAHRSLYDFLVPGESRESLSRLHRQLLENINQPLPQNLLRSSSEKFYNTPYELLLTIANGSLTLKKTLTFYRGRQQEQEKMACQFYLGGGLGTDIVEKIDLNQLYIVCVATTVIQQQQKSVTEPSSSIAGQQQQDDHLVSIATPSPTLVSSSSSSSSSSPTVKYDHLIEKDNHNGKYMTHSSSSTLNVDYKKFHSTTKRIQQHQHQFIHPNELYYLQTTSSRLSMEAVAHTTAYLSKTQQSFTLATGSGPLAAFNQHTTTGCFK
ncbi:uncharacterized protein BX663DRAFT_555765 [Cokeromyces recurvatus]|uniref:uncharacterized protein n=1 Tax=Cokeromyces recurvatus TaxID=90255 RepID=UPI00221F5D08|nr:uncharacterized protein BX663DRAFT_555765 [Cokeromyces recurvatus]KAI7898558.1 hypothetical protein BX663DRAFT_555765 [Cokeromyces recurvatus]